MPNEINPFEPWRPQSEPAREPPRARSHPEHPPSRQPVKATRKSNAWAEAHRAKKFRELMVGFTLFLLIGGIALTATLGGQHGSRVAAATFALWMGLFLALVVLCESRVRTRLLSVAGGALAAGLAWAFVPTTGGVTLWQAYRELAAVRSLAEDDPAGFTAGSQARAKVAEEFPELKSDFQGGEADWGRRFWAAEADRIEQVRPEDPLEAMKQLRHVRDVLRYTPVFAEVAKPLTEARRKSLLSHLDNQHAVLVRLVEKGKYAVVHEHAASLAEHLQPEARELDRHEQVAQRLHDVRTLAVRRHAEAARITLDRLLERTDYAAVAAEGKRLAEELAPLAKPLSMEREALGSIDAVRKKALSARLAGARKELEALLGKHDHAGVSRTARQLQEAMIGEAALVGLEGELYDSLRPARKKALAERLDRARISARELLRKDQYQAMGRVGEKAFDELREEAAIVGLEQEVARFRDSCRAFADLARKAEVKDGK